ncbi:MAG TPA: hypothetical protein VI172_01705 [Candidatus Dormibacteraeota bacterium]|jgi:hypothetical protein
MTNTWVVQITTHATRIPASMATAGELTAELQLRSGRTGEHGIDPQAAFLGHGRMLIRQTFPLVAPQQAVMLACEALRRHVRADEIIRIEAITIDDWRAQNPA